MIGAVRIELLPRAADIDLANGLAADLDVAAPDMERAHVAERERFLGLGHGGRSCERDQNGDDDIEAHGFLPGVSASVAHLTARDQPAAIGDDQPRERMPDFHVEVETAVRGEFVGIAPWRQH